MQVLYILLIPKVYVLKKSAFRNSISSKIILRPLESPWLSTREKRSVFVKGGLWITNLHEAARSARCTTRTYRRKMANQLEESLPDMAIFCKYRISSATNYMNPTDSFMLLSGWILVKVNYVDDDIFFRFFLANQSVHSWRTVEWT